MSKETIASERLTRFRAERDRLDGLIKSEEDMLSYESKLRNGSNGHTTAKVVPVAVPVAGAKPGRKKSTKPRAKAAPVPVAEVKKPRKKSKPRAKAIVPGFPSELPGFLLGVLRDGDAASASQLKDAAITGNVVTEATAAGAISAALALLKQENKAREGKGRKWVAVPVTATS